MIVIMWETIKRVINNTMDFLVMPPLTREAKIFDDLSKPVGEVCEFCGNRSVGMSGYCVGCGHDRGVPVCPSPVSIKDSFMIGSRIEIEVA